MPERHACHQLVQRGTHGGRPADASSPDALDQRRRLLRRRGYVVLHAVRPPVFDSPTTRGLFDPVSGVYWAADAFASMVTPGVSSADDLDPVFWEATFTEMNRQIAPWHHLVDDDKFAHLLRRLAAMPATTIVGAHGAVLRGEHITTAYGLLRHLPSMPEVQFPGQALLDELLDAPVAAV